MALLQIAEPGQSEAPHQRRLAVGIDLGTTNSLVAAVRSGSADILVDKNGHRSLPSVVRYVRGDAPLVGHPAEAATGDTRSTVRSAKRLMGKGASDLSDSWLSKHYQFDMKGGSLPAFVTDDASAFPWKAW